MKRWGIAVALVFGSALAVALTVLSVIERESLDADRRDLAELRELARLEVETRELVLAIRNGHLDTYDQLVVLDHEMKRKLEALSEHSCLQDILHPAEGLFASYRSDIEHFKRSRALLRNSLRYLPKIAEEATLALEASQQARLGVSVAHIAIALSQPFAQTPETWRLLEEVGSHRSELPSVERFLRHAEVVMESGRAADARVAALRDHPLVTLLDDAIAVHAEREEARSQRFSTIVLGASVQSGLLLIAMGLTLAALRRSAKELERTNEGLEEVIRVRSSELAQSQKLESIGQLAAGIAHEINTPAQFVSDNLEFIDDSVADLGPVFDAVDVLITGERAQAESEIVHLREAVERADLQFVSKELPGAVTQSREGISRVAEIVRAMKDFSHPGAEGFQSVDLNRAIQSTATVARNEWKYVAEVSFDLADALPSVPCIAGEINQCVLNILVNAAHAIGDRRNEEDPLGRIHITTRQEGDCARIEIRDDGGGIPEEAQPRVFDPFFTTKGVGKGTGQGLSIAYSSIVEKHAGTLDFEVEAGVGTTFRIDLPLERSEAIPT